MLMSVAGDFEPAAMKKLLREVFGDWRGGAATLTAVPKIADTMRPGVYLVERALPQSTIMLGHLGVNRFDPDKFPLFLLNYILGEGGFSSRLMQEVRSARGLAPARTGLEIGPLRLQPLERRAYLRDKEVPLSPTEFSVLHVMARRAGHVVTHAQEAIQPLRAVREVRGRERQDEEKDDVPGRHRCVSSESERKQLSRGDAGKQPQRRAVTGDG